MSGHKPRPIDGARLLDLRRADYDFGTQHIAHADKRRERPGAHLAHDLSAVDLDRGLGHAELAADALVRMSLDDQRHDLALAVCERGKASLHVGDGRRLAALYAVALDASMDGVEQFLIAERLAEKLDRSRLDCAHRHWDVAVAGNEDDRNTDAHLGQLLLKREPARTRQPHVEHETARSVCALRL